MEKKYQLTDENKGFFNRRLSRIQALKDFRDVKAGDLGGWVQSEDNLSHYGSCWVYDDAMVMDSAFVADSAIVSGKEITEEYLAVKGLAVVYDSAIVQDSAVVSGHFVIGGNAIIKSNAYVVDTVVKGNTVIGKDGYIMGSDCYFTIGNIGSRYGTTTFYLDKERNIWVNTGCFNDTLEAFEQAVIEKHGDNIFAIQYMKAVKFAKIMFNND